MDVPDEDKAQIARRGAIQAIMRDASLTSQEKQRKIQEYMASGTHAQVVAPEAATTPVADEGTGLSPNELIKQVMKDATLTPQEKQQKIQEIRKGGTAGTTMASAATLAPSEMEPLATKFSNGAPADAARPPGVGATASTGVDPAARKGSRGSVTITPVDSLKTVVNDSHEPMPPPVGLGAVSSTGVDPAARKGSRMGSLSSVAADVALDTASVGATPSTGVDPAARKGSRGSVTITPVDSLKTVVNDSHEPMPPPVGLGAVSSTGVDPAARKGSRMGSLSSVTADAALEMASVEPAEMVPSGPGAVTSSGIDPAAQKSRDRGSTAPVGEPHSVGASNARSSRYSDPAATKAARMARNLSASGRAESRSGSDEISEIREMEAEVIAKANMSGQVTARAQAPAPVQVELPSNYSSDFLPVVTQNYGREEANHLHSGGDEEQPVTYAGLGLIGPDIAGAETGGIQAFVAGDDRPEEIAAMEVVTDAAIEEEEKKKQKRVLRAGAAVCCLLLMAVVVPVAVMVPGGDKVVNITESPTMAPSAPPTGATFAELLDALLPLYPDDGSFQEAFSSSETPQYRAAEWAASTAPLDLTGDDSRMISRYALATFYFSTDGDSWLQCGVGSTNCDEGREWLTAENECEWFAVACADASGGDYTVLELFFPPMGDIGNNVSGTLPFELALLPSVERIVLSRQSLAGPIPENWSRMMALHTLIIGKNNLTGTFPDFLFSQNTLLGTLHVSSNKLKGTLPAFVSASLQGLRFDDNMFTGPIPSEFGSLTALKELYADNNALEGNLPEELYNLLSLQSLRMSNNTKITGTISESIGNLQSLQQLQIFNTSIGGPLPAGLFNLVELQVLELGVNAFSGPLSEGFGNLANVTKIQLNNNFFTGSIPTVFEGLQFLRTLELQGNDLTGTVSAGLCNRTGDGFFDINRLTADCLGNPPQVACDCCNECF